MEEIDQIGCEKGKVPSVFLDPKLTRHFSCINRIGLFSPLGNTDQQESNATIPLCDARSHLKKFHAALLAHESRHHANNEVIFAEAQRRTRLSARIRVTLRIKASLVDAVTNPV